MKRRQVLSSGRIIQQDFSDAVRAVFFQTEYEEFFLPLTVAPYSLSAFVVASTD
jgi:hypothetical protein